MQLVFATDDYVVAGRPREGFPILLWSSMESCVPANRFLQHYLQRGQIASKNSWTAIGRALYDYFGFLEANELSWDDVDRDKTQRTLVAGYRDYCLNDLRQRLNTVRLRLLYVCEFYEFAFKRGWIGKLPFELEGRRNMTANSFLAHARGRSTPRVPDIMPARRPQPIKFLPRLQIHALLNAPANVHHRMLIRLALHTGLRREELATFPVAYVFDPDKVHWTSRNVRVLLDPDDGHGMRTKGMRCREIFITRWFMKELAQYVKLHRNENIVEDQEPPTLFVNNSGKAFAAGGKAIERIVRTVGMRCGVQVHTHMLRHTYATHTLVALQRSRTVGLDPLVFVQKQLGHASIQTTMIYLHMINELADDAVLAYADELNDWLRD
jgi:integrase/recombinase XerD